MKTPYFIPADQGEEATRTSNIRKIFRESDDKARKLFERQDPNRPNGLKTPRVRPSKENDNP